MAQPTQRCGCCKQFKPLEDYNPSKRGAAGAQCKPCSNASRRGKRKLSVPHDPRQCIHCDKWYVPKQLKQKAMYCSRQCWVDARKARAEARKASKACCADRSCTLHHDTQRCGRCKQPKLLEDYIPTDRGVIGSWCKPCFNASRRSDLVPLVFHDPQQCVQCGGWYVPKRLYQRSKYCSEECNRAAKEARRAAKCLTAKSERVCLHCGSIIPREASKNKIFCSRQCNNRAHRLQRRLRDRVGAEAKAGYLFAEICMRDKWRCGICRKFVDKTLQYPDPMSPSLDHILQVWQGGDNDPSNLRLAHLICNQRRPRGSGKFTSPACP